MGVEQYLDELALYEVNYFHLHLSDEGLADRDRRAAASAAAPGSVAARSVYTQADYLTIVRYAAARYTTVVPEIDMPRHTNAALASYADLNCDSDAPPLQTGTDVGFNSRCVGWESTYQSIDQLAALTPGPYLHIRGDEAQSTSAADYTTFINRARAIVAAHGETVVGWYDVVDAIPRPSTVAQLWDTSTSNAAVAAAVKQGTKLIPSPKDHAYLDMKYTEATPLRQDWGGADRREGVRLGSRRRCQKRQGVQRPGRGGSAVVGDPRDDGWHRAHGVPAAAGHRGVVTGVDPRLDRVQETAGRPGSRLPR